MDRSSARGLALEFAWRCHNRYASAFDGAAALWRRRFLHQLSGAHTGLPARSHHSQQADGARRRAMVRRLRQMHPLLCRSCIMRHLHCECPGRVHRCGQNSWQPWVEGSARDEHDRSTSTRRLHSVRGVGRSRRGVHRRHGDLRSHHSLYFCLFLDPLHAAFGWKRESMGGAFALAAITVAPVSPLIGLLSRPLATASHHSACDPGLRGCSGLSQQAWGTHRAVLSHILRARDRGEWNCAVRLHAHHPHLVLPAPGVRVKDCERFLGLHVSSHTPRIPQRWPT